MTMSSTVADRLYACIAHGDAEHRAWLKEAIDKFYEAEKHRAMTTPPMKPDGNSSSLLPCPFCGGTSYVAGDYGSSFSVKCNNPICGGAVRLWATSEKAIAAWNRRASSPSSPPDAVLEALESIQDLMKSHYPRGVNQILNVVHDLLDTALSRYRGRKA